MLQIVLADLTILKEKAETTEQIIAKILTQTQTEHMAVMAGIGVLLIVGIAILINQRKIKKQLKKLLEEKDKP